MVTGVAIACVGGIALSQTQALADPGITYLAVGSDTIQDFTDGWAGSLTPGQLGSYDAVNPTSKTAHEVITPAKTGITSGTTAIVGGNCSFNRPNGSSEGVKALLDSLGLASPNGGTIGGENIAIGSTTGTLPANSPQANCVDIARSSRGPNIVDATAGPLQFIPFALDAVTAAIGPSTSQTISNAAGTGTEASPTTNLGAVASVGFSTAGLKAMFGSGNDAVAENATGPSVCYAPFQGGDLQTSLPAGVTCSSTVVVDLYVPQNGSGTLSFWATSMGFSTTPTVPAWDHQTIVNGAGTTLSDYATAATPVAVEEHDGTAFAADPNGIGPFSIAQWIAQNNGIDPRFHGAQLLSVDTTSPLNGTVLNTSFPIRRQVYMVAPYNHLQATGATNPDSVLTQLLVSASAGAPSLLCKQSGLILHFGFGLLNTSDSPLGDFCGQVDTTQLRADQ